MFFSGMVMKSTWIELKKVAEVLQEKCPFITFALLNGIDKDGSLNAHTKLELSVFVDSGIGTLAAIEMILPAMTSVAPGAMCEVTLLNHVDPTTRHFAMQDICLFIRNGQEQFFRDFGQRSSLDYRILCAQNRRRKLIQDD